MGFQFQWDTEVIQQFIKKKSKLLNLFDGLQVIQTDQDTGGKTMLESIRPRLSFVDTIPAFAW